MESFLVRRKLRSPPRRARRRSYYAIKECTLGLPRLAMVRGSWLRGGAVLLALLLAGPLSVRAEDEDHGDVLVLTDSNFDKIVNNEKIMVRAWAAPLRGAT